MASTRCGIGCRPCGHTRESLGRRRIFPIRAVLHNRHASPVSAPLEGAIDFYLAIDIRAIICHEQILVVMQQMIGERLGELSVSMAKCI